MATAKSTNVIIGGKQVDPYQITVQQRSDWHHSFEVAVAAEKIGDKASDVSIDSSIDHVGKTAEIEITCTDSPLKFKGVITTIRIDRTYTGDNLIIFGGYSPTYLLEDGAATKSFEEKDISAIANEIFGTYPGNLLNASVQPQYSGTIPYIVQYKETNYQFLSRIAATYGEWFFYDGQGITFGKLPSPGSVELTLGKDLDSFDYGVQLRPSNVKNQFYNYTETRTLEESSKGFKPGWLDNYGKKALDAADSIFPNEPINPTWQNAPKDPLIKHLTEARKSAILSDTTFFKGRGSNSGIVVGSRIQVKANNKVGKQIVPGFVGNFRITAVTHHLDANKDYSNSFEAIPVTVTAPLFNKNVFKPEAESQVAVVKENNDPQGLGRVRVQFKWQSGKEMTPWIRQITNHASGDRGTYFVPELEDEVYVDFVQGNPDRPYMQGAVYHSKATPEFFDPDNNYKTIKTRTGHLFQFNDTAGGESITITDKNGNIIHIDTAGNNITISALENMTLNAKNMNINVQENLFVGVGHNMETNVGKNNRLSVIEDQIITSKNEDKKVGEEIKVISKDYKQEAQEILTKTSGKYTTKAGGKIKIASAATIEYGE